MELDRRLPIEASPGSDLLPPLPINKNADCRTRSSKKNKISSGYSEPFMFYRPIPPLNDIYTSFPQNGEE